MAKAESIQQYPAAALDARTAGASGPPAVPGNSPSTSPVDLRILFDAHYAAVWRLLRRLGVDAARVEDAAQEVFWVAARRLTEIQSGREYAFLYGVALRVAAAEARRRRTSPRLAGPDDLGLLADEGPSPEEHMELRRTRELLDLVLDKMPMQLRAVFVLFEFEGMEVREIAAIHQIPVGTASSRLRRARDEFSRAAKRLHAALRGQESGWR